MCDRDIHGHMLLCIRNKSAVTVCCFSFHDESLVLLSLREESQESTNKFTSLFGPRNVREMLGQDISGMYSWFTLWEGDD